MKSRDDEEVSYPRGEQATGKNGRVWLGALQGNRAEVVPASNRVSMRVAEQERQIRLSRSNRKYKYLLLPDSMIRYCWDLLLAIATILLIWRVPYTIAFGDSDLWYWFLFNKTTDAIYLLDVALNFRTGYVEDTEIIMDSRLVAKHYFKSWFIVDLIGSIPIEYIITVKTAGISSVERKAFKASVKYMKLPKLFRVARLIKFVQKYMKFAYAVQVFACYISFIHWVACLWAGPIYRGTQVAVPGVIGSSSRALQYQEKVRLVMSDLKALHVPNEMRKSTKKYYETLWRMKNTSDRTVPIPVLLLAS
ncbi:voltage-gated ion channel superfamily [Plasmopara halstedii]|uniref:Voltage-gated ion channel superfamily n=1 Tax=Plasmopara halstedii TaxID=4781 RepID=A0A0N7L4T2_PLAHL|nr:voltage-gated ion channel superfamily [Plasmopara halstedii]CEG39547.1 voltage-gated ion channel superfamily [Plasmopara halstedii]|eukprot:XP_024575916.1 voltage-gated ion channel superfamily [Plasmopara halstedii]